MREKIILIATVSISILSLIAGCSNPEKVKTSRNTLLTFPCEGVLMTSSMTDTFVIDKSKADSISADISAAAKADADLSVKYIDSAAASVKLSANLSRTVKKYVKRTTNISEDFWGQSFRFAQAMCILQNLRKDKSVPVEKRNQIIDDIRELVNSQSIYDANAKKKLQN